MSDNRLQILLVEDNAADARLVRHMLAVTNHGGITGRFDVRVVGRVSEALAALVENTCHVVLLDLSLPDASGLEALHRLRAAAPQLPIVVMSGLADEEVAVRAVQDGAQDYLVKSMVESPLLVRAIRYGLERQRIEKALRESEGLYRSLTEELEQRVRERTADLESANLAKDRFLATMSHELRTPLNAIIGFTGTLLMKLPGPLTPDQEKQLKTIQASARHLLSLINGLLNLAKIESGKVELVYEEVVCQSVLEEVATTLRPAAEAKGLAFEVHALGDALSVLTDRRALSQIILNLVNNAIKFTEQGGIRLELARRVGNGRDQIEISVADTGLGIKPEDQSRLFQAFEQLDAGSTRRHEGTGLGLHLSLKLAGWLGGHITFASEYGKGSTFTLVIPEK